MKSIAYLISFISMLICLEGCKKGSLDLFTDHSVYLPEVKMVSVQMMGDTIVLSGEVTNQGSFPLKYTGFCYSKNPLPQILENQILCGGDKTFHAYVFNLQAKDTFYFRSFAANNGGYSYGDVIEYIVQSPKPPVVPCTLANNKISVETNSYTVTDARTSTTFVTVGTFEITADCYYSGGFNYFFDFLRKPYSGIYTTADISDIDFDNPYNKNVYVSATGGFSSPWVLPGGKIYISYNNDKYTVSFCDLQLQVDDKKYHLQGNFTTK